MGLEVLHLRVYECPAEIQLIYHCHRSYYLLMNASIKILITVCSGAGYQGAVKPPKYGKKNLPELLESFSQITKEMGFWPF